MTTQLDKAMLRAWRSLYQAVQQLPPVDTLETYQKAAGDDMAKALGSMRLLMTGEAKKECAQWEQRHWRKIAKNADLASIPERIFKRKVYVTPPPLREVLTHGGQWQVVVAPAAGAQPWIRLEQQTVSNIETWDISAREEE